MPPPLFGLFPKKHPNWGIRTPLTKILKIVESFRTEKDEMLNQESIIPTFLGRVLAHC